MSPASIEVRPRTRARSGSSLTALAAFTALTALLFHRVWQSPAHSWIGVKGDPQLFIWFVRWGAYAVAHRVDPFVTHHLNYPVGVNLMWNTAMPLLALVLSPVTLSLGPTVAYNLAVTAGVALSGWCAYLMIGRYVHSSMAAFVGALVYAFSPAVLVEAYGHLHFVVVFVPPLMFLVLDELLVRQQRPFLRTGAVLGILVATQVLLSEELATSEALAAGLAAVILAALFPGQVRARLPHALRALAVTAAVAFLLLAWPLSVEFFGPQRITGGPLQPTDVYVSDALGFVVPTAAQQLAPASVRHSVSDRFTGNGAEWTAYVGIPLLAVSAIVAVGMWRRPMVRVVALLAGVLAVLSLGPHLHVRGRV
ncbi:MAG TPA: hypothetical protein VKI64_10970, partial [Acidimicrobiales bacterium]|nr:hypothetical protein [Acidimicrobiales bacterium]